MHVQLGSTFQGTICVKRKLDWNKLVVVNNNLDDSDKWTMIEEGTFSKMVPS